MTMNNRFSLSDISIKNPVFAWMLMIGLIVFGAVCFMRMGISQLPDVDFPVLTVSITWQGAAPEVMESAVTDVVEDAVMSVDGIQLVSSTSREGIATITIQFALSQDINVSLQQVQAKIAQAQKNLPTDIDPPIVTKSNPEDQPILWTAVSGDRPLRDMIVFTRDHLKDNLTTIAGVGDVFLGGYVDPNLRIWLRADKMRAREIAVDDVIASVRNEHILPPSGYMDEGPREINVKVYGEATNAEEFRKLIIPTRAGAPIWKTIHLGDVASVEEGLNDIRRISRMNGKRAVGLGILKQRGTNAVAVGDAVRDRMRKLRDVLPSGLAMGIVTDSTKFIKDSTHELLLNLLLSVLLTSIVCYVFLGSWSSAFNVILAIPTSLIGAFIILRAFGFTLNTFTLLGLSLSIGIVVDDAIMVLENIVRHKEEGLSRVRAAIVGAREITTAAIAASLAILAIFLPVVFMDGIIGKFFFQFGVTMSAAVMLSLLEALTLAPMRCSQFLQTSGDTWLSRHMDRFMGGLSTRYRHGLDACLRWRWTVILIALAVFFSSLLLAHGVRKELVPPQDQSRFLISLYTPLGSSLDLTDKVFKQAETILLSRPEIEGYYSAIGGFQGGVVNTGNIFVTMKEPKNRSITAPFKHIPTQQEYMGFVRQELKKIPGVERAVMQDLSLSGFTAKRGFPVEFTVQGPDWDKLAELSGTMRQKLADSGLMTDIDTDYQLGMPELAIHPDRVKAASRGVTVTNIGNAISALVGGLRVGKYTDESGHRDDIRIKLLQSENQSATDLHRIWLRNQQGELVPLSDVVTTQQKPSLLLITRYNRERAISIFANVAPGKSQSDAIAYVTKTAKQVLPEGYHVVLSGSSQTFKESGNSLMVAFILGIFVAYMVLASQFNSFLHPIVVLLALPFSLTGALLAIRIAGISLNIYSTIGILLLMGIVKKNSILLVDFTNERRKLGKSVNDALVEACPIRLRPILMTSIATVVAAIPPAFALGAGSETTRPMAIVVIGGVIVSTFLTLFVVPCAYSLISRLESKTHAAELVEALQELGELPAESKPDGQSGA
jgi:hydrophobe/amphiphile efflux-1 (HAE1) family protein